MNYMNGLKWHLLLNSWLLLSKLWCIEGSCCLRYKGFLGFGDDLVIVMFSLFRAIREELLIYKQTTTCDHNMEWMYLWKYQFNQFISVLSKIILKYVQSKTLKIEFISVAQSEH